MNAWRRLLVIVLLTAAPLVQAALVPRLIGHWLSSYRGQRIELLLNADGSGSYQGQAIKWDFRYGQLHLDRDGEVEVFAMKADAETLVMAGGERATLLVFVRVSEPVAEPAEDVDAGTEPASD